ncbi:hypothetical protein ACI784_07355 [Geodermatophilus sp. SYSU D01186]
MSSTTGGGGHNNQTDDDLAIIDADLATTLAQAAARVAFGTASRVLGCADDPGSHPG